jgi:hypothetical protein
MSEDRARILQMVSEGKIDASQGVELLSALNSEKKPDGPAAASTSTGKASWFRVRVTDMETGRTKVNVNLPFSLVRAGLKIGARFSPEVDEVDWEEVIGAIDEGTMGRLVEVEDPESGEKVEVFVD